MFNRFTERLKSVLGRAHREALQRGDPEVGPGHLLVALLVVRLGNAHRALKNEKLTVAVARGALLRAVGPGSGKSDANRTAFSAAALAALERTQVVACDLDMDEIDTPHLLLGLLADKDGVPSRMLETLEVPPARVRSETFRILQHQGALSGSSMELHLRRIRAKPEAAKVSSLLDRAEVAHRDAFKAKEWERAARIAGAISEISFAVYSGFRENWVVFAKRRLDAILPMERSELPDGWPPEAGAT
jgi:ATP-dependent Clp protease ATP-binding subunit ClpA